MPLTLGRTTNINDSTPAIISRATTRAPGTCGELAQGMLDGAHYLVTCPIDMYSTATVDLVPGTGRVHAPSGASKTHRAVELTLAHLNRRDVDAYVRLCNPLPRGKGMASSTADVAAAIKATAIALRASDEMTAAHIARIALRVEPSDGVMLPGIALFDHKRGSTAQTLGDAPPMRAIILDFGGKVDTVAFNRVNHDTKLRQLRPSFEDALALIKTGIRSGSAAEIGAGATLSAITNQHLLYKPQLDAVMRFANEQGALGVNAAHSGSVLGILLPDDEAFAAHIAARARQRLPGLKRIYNRRIIGGGVTPIENDSPS